MGLKILYTVACLSSSDFDGTRSPKSEGLWKLLPRFPHQILLLPSLVPCFCRVKYHSRGTPFPLWQNCDLQISPFQLLGGSMVMVSQSGHKCRIHEWEVPSNWKILNEVTIFLALLWMAEFLPCQTSPCPNRIHALLRCVRNGWLKWGKPFWTCHSSLIWPLLQDLMGSRCAFAIRCTLYP